MQTKEKTVDITLDYPVHLADRELENVTMRRPSVGDLMDFPVNATTGLKEELALVAHLCELHVDDLRLMDSEDYGRLQKQLLRFRGISID